MLYFYLFPDIFTKDFPELRLKYVNSVNNSASLWPSIIFRIISLQARTHDFCMGGGLNSRKKSFAGDGCAILSWFSLDAFYHKGTWKYISLKTLIYAQGVECVLTGSKFSVPLLEEGYPVEPDTHIWYGHLWYLTLLELEKGYPVGPDTHIWYGNLGYLTLLELEKGYPVGPDTHIWYGNLRCLALSGPH